MSRRFATRAAHLGYVAVILFATLSQLQPDFEPDRILDRARRALDLSVNPFDAIGRRPALTHIPSISFRYQSISVSPHP